MSINISSYGNRPSLSTNYNKQNPAFGNTFEFDDKALRRDGKENLRPGIHDFYTGNPINTAKSPQVKSCLDKINMAGAVEKVKKRLAECMEKDGVNVKVLLKTVLNEGTPNGEMITGEVITTPKGAKAPEAILETETVKIGKEGSRHAFEREVPHIIQPPIPGQKSKNFIVLIPENKKGAYHTKFRFVETVINTYNNLVHGEQPKAPKEPFVPAGVIKSPKGFLTYADVEKLAMQLIEGKVKKLVK